MVRRWVRFGADGQLQERRIDHYGVYLQDTVSFGDHWKLLLGNRYDMVKTGTFDYGTANEKIVTDKWDRAFSPRAGLVFQPVENLEPLHKLYHVISYPPYRVKRPTVSLSSPTTGEQFEIGVKRDWFDGRLSTTLAAFQLTKSNIATADPKKPRARIQVGEQRSRGVELDVAGELSPAWRVTGSLAYLSAKITKDNTLPVGNRLTNVPEWSGSLWAMHSFQTQSLRGLEVGGGVFVVGDRKGDFANKIGTDAYARVDLAARYEVNDNVDLAFNIDNLFDEKYAEFTYGNGSSTLSRRAPLRIRHNSG